MIPPTYLDELSLLQDQITPFSTEVAFNMIEDELGLPIDELFSEISPEPVAAASLGQVREKHVLDGGLKLILMLVSYSHSIILYMRSSPKMWTLLLSTFQVYQARLRRSGKVVAVKVQRPGVRAAIALDTLILRYVAGLIKKAGRFNSDLEVL